LRVITITIVLKHPQKKTNPFAWIESIFSDNIRYEWMQLWWKSRICQD